MTFALYQFLEQEELQRQVEEMRQQFQEAGELTLAKEYERNFYRGTTLYYCTYH